MGFKVILIKIHSEFIEFWKKISGHFREASERFQREVHQNLQRDKCASGGLKLVLVE